MRNTFILKGLDCAACAAKIENKLKKQAGIKDASINFITGKLIVESDVNFNENMMMIIEKVVKKEEPDVKIIKY